jgi:hypothetical protein
MPGLYSINTPQRLFQKLAYSFAQFCSLPSEGGIYEVIFPLYHLREWICPSGHGAYKNKAESDFTKAESLHHALHFLPEYQIVRDLCNNAKHFNHASIDERTAVLEGFRCGLGHCEDSLGVTHFLVDGLEIRSIFWPVYTSYFDYFKVTDPIFLDKVIASLKDDRQTSSAT